MSNSFFSLFAFIRVDQRFKHLEANEKISAKQEFENVVANTQEKVFFRTYALSNLKEDCDILMWRMHPSLDYLQEICTKTFSVGVGRFMEIKYTYIGFKRFDCSLEELNYKVGIYPYLLLHPLVKLQSWYELEESERNKLMHERLEIINLYQGIIETIFESYGIGDEDMIVVREAKNLDELIKCTLSLKKLKNKNYTQIDKPVFLCIGRDLRHILDMLG